MRHVERAKLPEPPRRHRIGIARRLAERRQDTAATQTAERILERRLADRIIDHRHALAARDGPNPFDEFFATMDDRMIAAMGVRVRRFLLIANGADHGGAEMPCPLAHDQANAARCGVSPACTR
jgi:exoribonuclease II